MKTRQLLGEVEQLVLLVILRLGEGAYAVPIREELHRNGVDLSRGSVYVTLDRLDRKGLLSSRLGEPVAARGGRPRRYYAVSRRGRALLKHECGTMERLWAGLGLVPER